MELATATRIARKIQSASNLHAVIPVWSDGSHLNVGSIEEHHGRMEWVYRGTLDFVDGAWVVTGSDAVRDLVASVLAEV